MRRSVFISTRIHSRYGTAYEPQQPHRHQDQQKRRGFAGVTAAGVSGETYHTRHTGRDIPDETYKARHTRRTNHKQRHRQGSGYSANMRTESDSRGRPTTALKQLTSVFQSPLPSRPGVGPALTVSRWTFASWREARRPTGHACPVDRIEVTGQVRSGQGRAGQGRAGQGR